MPSILINQEKMTTKETKQVEENIKFDQKIKHKMVFNESKKFLKRSSNRNNSGVD